MPEVIIAVDFDQDVINFDSSDITVTENLPGASAPGSITAFTVVSALQYEVTWTHNDDGSGGSIDFLVKANVCNGAAGNVLNIASTTLNAIVQPF